MNWHDKATALKDQGVRQKDIARECDVSEAAVSQFFAARRNEARALDEIAARRAPRKPRQIINYKALMPACIDFAAERIGREELMRRISAP